MKKLIQALEKITDIAGGYLQGVIIILLLFMVLLEVLTRYILHAPLSIADEMGGYMLISITFLGLGYTWKEKGHVSVELVTNMLPPKLKQRLRLMTLIIALVFCYPLITGSYELLQDSLLFESRSGSWLRTPLVYPQSLLLIGSVLLLIQLVAELFKALYAIAHPEVIKPDVITQKEGDNI